MPDKGRQKWRDWEQEWWRYTPLGDSVVNAPSFCSSHMRTTLIEITNLLRFGGCLTIVNTLMMELWVLIETNKTGNQVWFYLVETNTTAETDVNMLCSLDSFTTYVVHMWRQERKGGRKEGRVNKLACQPWASMGVVISWGMSSGCSLLGHIEYYRSESPSWWTPCGTVITTS